MFERVVLMNSAWVTEGLRGGGAKRSGLGAINIELAWWPGPIDTRFASGSESRPVHVQVVEGPAWVCRAM
jgi:hypothetical protein